MMSCLLLQTFTLISSLLGIYTTYILQSQIAKITEEGVTISQPYSLKTFWGFSAFQNPTVGAEGSW